MQNIQDLFDSSRQLNRTIESVVTFGANTEEDLSSEIREYVVTDKLHTNYENIIRDLQEAFNNSSKEVGVWVSGFYGSGKSSFAKYLGLSFDKSVLVDGVTFGEKLMSRINDTAISAMHRTVISRHNPQVIMIDLSTQSVAGKVSSVSDIVYYETLKLLGITKSTDQKVMCFVDMLHSEGRYEDFCRIVKDEWKKQWEDIEANGLIANSIVTSLAPRILPEYFADSESYKSINLSSALSEKERFVRLQKLIKEKTGKDKIIFVLDEVGQYVASNVELILNLQGMLQIFKDEFKGGVWVIATAQQTLTEDNRQAQLNSNELFRLNDRFPVKVDIEANDIKEIITKRLLGKSAEGKSYLQSLFTKNEGLLKNSIHLSLQERSIYNQVVTAESFADLYPFLPVHIDILMSLLQKLASRTGGVGLRSVIRLIRDILVDNHLASATIGTMAGPEHFYDVLHSDMEKNTVKEIVMAADRAIQVFSGDALAVRICKTIAVMQILDDFNLTFDNLCALLYNFMGATVDKAKIRQTIESIKNAEGLTLQDIEGRYQFMTNAILGIREERNKIIPRDVEKAQVLQTILQDIFNPVPAVNIYSTKTITAGIELNERNRTYIISQTSSLKINIRFVEGSAFADARNMLLTESTRSENNKTLFWLCTLNKEKESILIDIVRSRNIKMRHQNETNAEIKAYLKAQSDNAEEKERQLSQILREAMGNSEIIFRGSPQVVDAETYKTVALKNIAEKVFEKYPLASTNMKSDCVTKLASYADIKTIPSSLNPFGIIDVKQGMINISNQAIKEIKDYVMSRPDLSGAELMSHFEKEPYGWSKDTVRYIAALMLKGSVIQLRVTGKDITVFGDAAVEAMATNNSFGKAGISLNTEGALTPAELIKAAQTLTSLFGSTRIVAMKDAIAKEAYSKIKRHVQQYRDVQRTFEAYGMNGAQLIRSAIGYCERIMESEGGEGAYLLGKDEDCIRAIKYVADVLKCNQTSAFIESIKHLRHVIDGVGRLAELDELGELKQNIHNVEQLYNDYIAREDIHAIAPDITDLKNQADAYLVQGCVHFQTSTNTYFNGVRDEIKQSDDYNKLTDKQRAEIDIRLDGLTIDCRSNDVEGLQEMVNNFASFGMSRINHIKGSIKENAKRNAPAVVVEPAPAETQPVTPTPTHVVNEPQYAPKRIRVKSRLTTKAELQQVITELTQMLDTISDNTPVEININE